MSDSEKLPILVVEDEEAIRRGLCDVLAYHGFEPVSAATGEDGLREALTGRFALVLLDVMLPGMSGFDVCSGVREQLAELPILMLTARGSEEDILEGFERGADDYVTKPFSISELLARVKALLRRAGVGEDEGGAEEAPAAAAGESGFPFGAWQIDPDGLRAHAEGGSVDLTKRELAVLELFAREADRIVSRRQLLQEIWGYTNPERIETRTVDMQIGKLRKKLDRGEVSYIETVRGAGYRYTRTPAAR